MTIYTPTTESLAAIDDDEEGTKNDGDGSPSSPKISLEVADVAKPLPAIKRSSRLVGLRRTSFCDSSPQNGGVIVMGHRMSISAGPSGAAIASAIRRRRSSVVRRT